MMLYIIKSHRSHQGRALIQTVGHRSLAVSVNPLLQKTPLQVEEGGGTFGKIMNLVQLIWELKTSLENKV